MRILGIDPALTTTGYGLIEFKNNKPRLIEAGVVRTDAKDDLAKRLNKIYRSLLKLVDETKPDVLVLEKLYAHYAHPTTAYLLGHARGVVCLLCAVKNIPLVEYAATHVRKAVLGRGSASKLQVQQMVMHVLSLGAVSPKYFDVTDALALALAHTNVARSRL
ncbi:MAG: crossover junction endodeoxyribonuclease RuvC [Candidatus Omnitrophica bacterium]|nr:crossover junction endodeoxyribonuclease RuvC [Candidatus Omnitrophota bacterium]MDD5237086.1 crossover junction endodeoxyribonuclease RuvC [Candidatus Omnitrophota bacterium]MDD5610965.1 crossover junction endodeoxyribonuclease RuvC [Candidatus Omnitrophota bacterium]